MIRRFRICLCITCLILEVFRDAAYSQDKIFPKYSEVVDHFFKTVPLENYKKPVLSFQKKQDGWFTEISNEKNDTLIEIWDSKKQSYVDTIFFEEDTSSEFIELKKKHIKDWQKVHYDACPYFGYRTWYKDVLEDYSDYSGNDAELIYGIGRAYSTQATNLLSDQFGDNDTLLFKYKSNDETLSTEQLKLFRYHRHKAIDCFTRVTELNPKYETLVGEINLKREFEYLTAYLDLIQFSTVEEALQELPDNLFSPFYHEYARNLLAGCKKNAILFTNGDMDTFLPLYIQLKENFRKDVVVINSGMLALPRYCNYLKKYFHIRFSLDDSDSDQKNLAYAYLQKDSTNAIWTTKDIFKILNDPTQRKNYSGYTYASLPTNHFTIAAGKHSIDWRSDAEYLYKYQLLIIDCIGSNLKQRPVYFASTNSSENYEGFEHFLSTNIMTFELMDQYQLISPHFQNLNLDKCCNEATRIFKWDNVTTAVSHGKMIQHNYAMLLARLAEGLASANKADSSMQIIDLYMRNFSNDELPFDYFTIPIVRAYYILEKFSQGTEVAKRIVYNYRHDIDAIDDSVVRQKAEKYTGLIPDVREVMRRFSQDDSVLDSDL